MAEDEIRALKAALNVSTDVALAQALGVERSSISQWKRRGAVPRKYRAYLGAEGMVSELTRLLAKTRHNFLGRAENHFWLRAALAFMPSYFVDPPGVGPAEVGRSREGPLILLVNLAMIATNIHLGKARCETESDYEALVEAMLIHEWELIDSIIHGDEEGESPQSGSSIGGEGEKA